MVNIILLTSVILLVVVSIISIVFFSHGGNVNEISETQYTGEMIRWERVNVYADTIVVKFKNCIVLYDTTEQFF